MAQVEFNIEGKTIIIPCNLNDTMKDILQKFSIKMEKKQENLFCIYGGNSVKLESTFEELASAYDKERKKITILIYENDEEIEKKTFKMSKYIICPKCQENARINIDGDKINLYNCKNNHDIKDLSFKEFENSQLIDNSKIECQICKKSNKSETYENKFFICFTCKMNICPLCVKNHDKTHNSIDFDRKYFTCDSHIEQFSSYCEECNKDICLYCEKQHNGHKIISYGVIVPDINELNNVINKLNTKIEENKKIYKELIDKNEYKEYIELFKKTLENIEFIHKIILNLINNYDKKDRNYNILQNLNYMNNYINLFINKIQKVINSYNGLTNEIDNNSPQPISSENKNNKNEIIIENKSDNKNNYSKVNDKYENFKISKIKKIMTFGKNKRNLEMIVLQNGKRILTYDADANYESNRLLVYNLDNNNNCDIAVVYPERIYKMIQMDDDIIIVSGSYNTKVIKIKEKEIEILQNLEVSMKNQIYKSLNNKLIFYAHNTIYSVSFLDNQIKQGNEEISIKLKEDYYIYNVCQINDKEIIIYCYVQEKNIFGKYSGDKDYLIFYDIKNNKIIESLKIGSNINERKNKMILMNENDLIIEHGNSDRIILVDVKKHKIITDIKYEGPIEEMISLNEKTFLVLLTGKLNYQTRFSYKPIFQYEIIKDKKVKVIKIDSFEELDFRVFVKFPGNKLVIDSASDGQISLYE